ncbi:MAG: hypothetical protein HKM92_08575, partial [Arenibacter sp.]|nr:hypothetical protein [Arenibacter sp.]
MAKSKKEATLLLKIKTKGQKGIKQVTSVFQGLTKKVKALKSPFDAAFELMGTLGSLALKAVGPLLALGAAMFSLAKKGDELAVVR